MSDSPRPPASPESVEESEACPHCGEYRDESPKSGGAPVEGLREAIEEMQSYAKILGRMEFCWERDDDVPTYQLEKAQKDLTAAIVNLESLFKVLRDERDALHQQFYELQQAAADEVLALRSQLSGISQTALTEEDADYALHGWLSHGKKFPFMCYCSDCEDLRAKLTSISRSPDSDK